MHNQERVCLSLLACDGYLAHPEAKDLATHVTQVVWPAKALDRMGLGLSFAAVTIAWQGQCSWCAMARS